MTGNEDEGRFLAEDALSPPEQKQAWRRPPDPVSEAQRNWEWLLQQAHHETNGEIDEVTSS